MLKKLFVSSIFLYGANALAFTPILTSNCITSSNVPSIFHYFDNPHSTPGELNAYAAQFPNSSITPAYGGTNFKPTWDVRYTAPITTTTGQNLYPYTGFSPSSSYFQKGGAQSPYSIVSTYQLECKNGIWHGGALINTWEFVNRVSDYGGPMAHFGYQFAVSGANAPAPWTTPDSYLMIQALTKVPAWLPAGGSVNGQANYYVNVRSKTTGELFGYVINIYANNGVPPENAGGYDPTQHQSYITSYVSTTTLNYTSGDVNSTPASNSTWSGERLSRVYITYINLKNALAGVHAQDQEPSNYFITAAKIGIELGMPTIDYPNAGWGETSLGFSFRAFELYGK